MPLNYPDSTAFGEKGCLLICRMIMSRNMNLNCGDNTMLRQLRLRSFQVLQRRQKNAARVGCQRIDCIYRKNSDRLFQKLRPGGDFSLFHTEIIAEDTAVDGSKRKTVREQEQQGFACRFFQQRTCDIMRIVLRKKHKNHREKNSINHRSKKKQVCFFFFPFSNVTGNMSESAVWIPAHVMAIPSV